MYCSGLKNVVIPNSVTYIYSDAFAYCSGLTNVTIGNGVASIGYEAFGYCSGLKSVTIPNSVASIGGQAFMCCSGLTTVVIGNSVTSIGYYAFSSCSSLTSVTIPNSVISIGSYAFSSCSGLQQAYFQGNAPLVNGGAGNANGTVFYGETGTVYYILGTTGWGSTFGGWLTAQWHQLQPQILGFSKQGSGFQFTIFWANNTPVVVEASTNLVNWVPIYTNTLVNGTNLFRDVSAWTNFPQRFYRVASSSASINSSSNSYQGIFTGQFSGQTDSGGFAMLVRSNQTGVLVGYDTPQEGGVYASNFTVSSNGLAIFAPGEGGIVYSTFTTTSVSGVFTNNSGAPGSFSGTCRPPSGIQATNAGYYVGTFSGSYSGTARAILAADGTLFCFMYVAVEAEDGGFGTVNAANTVSAYTANGISISGTLNPGTKVMSGTYSSTAFGSGTWTMTRTESAY